MSVGRLLVLNVTWRTILTASAVNFFPVLRASLDSNLEAVWPQYVACSQSQCHIFGSLLQQYPTSNLYFGYLSLPDNPSQNNNLLSLLVLRVE